MEYIIKKTPYEMTINQYEMYLEWCELIQWARKNPISFVNIFLGIEFLDFQKYIFMNTWTATHAVWCASRSSGKSFLSSPYIMTRSMLFPNHETKLLANSAKQSKITFNKLEKVAKKQITSLTSLTDVFFNELVKSNSSTDGFKHEQSTCSTELFNGSKIESLSSAFDRNRGFRSDLNFYDEFGFSPEELFAATDPFLAQDADFSLGTQIADINVDQYRPKQIPRQRILASSASSIDAYYFKLYKDYSEQMFLGNTDYFVADINCDVILKPKLFGVTVKPLVAKETVDAAIRQDKEAGMREYYNKFTRDGGDQQVIKRSVINRNCEVYLPEYNNVDNSEYVIAWDPAREWDNSIVTIGKLFNDSLEGLQMKIVNCISFADIKKIKRTPISTPHQVERVKQLMLDYNGKGVPDYDNIGCLLIDKGSGGGGNTTSDYFMDEWRGNDGKLHKGLIDATTRKEEFYYYPNAIDKIKLIEPKSMKVKMFDALIEMMKLGHIKLPIDYIGSDIFKIHDDEDNEKIIMLSDDQKSSFTQIDLLKEEMANIYRYDGTNSGYRYDLNLDKKNKMNDDRAFTMAMLGWYLSERRRKPILQPVRENDLSVFLDYAFTFNNWTI